MKILETERLVMRRLVPADLDDLYALYRDPEIRRYFPEGTLTLDETRDAQPYDLLTRIFPEELMRVFRLYAVEYHCPYDEGKVKDMLLGLGREEVESILAEQGEVVIRNEMCNHEYRFDAKAIEELFALPLKSHDLRLP